MSTSCGEPKFSSPNLDPWHILLPDLLHTRIHPLLKLLQVAEAGALLSELPGRPHRYQALVILELSLYTQLPGLPTF